MPTAYKKIGVIREGKTPADRRVPLTPAQCKEVMQRFPDVDLVVQRSPVRAYTDAEYEAFEIPMADDLADRDLILGIKEIPIDMLVPGKAHQFFSHTIKKQPSNAKLLKAVLDKKVRLIDHELLTDVNGDRVLAFGYWAGVVGAYNAFRGRQFSRGGKPMKPANECHDLEELETQLRAFSFQTDLRVVLTGGGRVGKGAMGVLERAGVTRVDNDVFMKTDHPGPVYTVLGSSGMFERMDGKPFDREAFHADPSGHRSKFLPYAKRAHMYIACHYWDARAPKILTAADLREPGISLDVIADISCDIGGPIDSTLRATTIADPFYGYDPTTAKEKPAGSEGTITVMSVDNLPAELPRDASEAFGRDLIERVIPSLTGIDTNDLIARATIANNGELTNSFKYLADYANS
ncbi:MAG: alanine dehydrogenase [Flavobacteriales bacterium]|nr:alanine dehydrogenase [Flavobacteriales bacterium]MBK6943484.1 alanine dehydrogenase [Flavobacteriales bacterium]MBK7240628.1 alanine dehydrogenase [Flavobacteriales bacterium]MBK7297314.1 alanine dehydrogenase [Flavobacteriales bacterium]MBP9138846.1 alanine dehydrogenase [Flavobacteriales bacterium]